MTFAQTIFLSALYQESIPEFEANLDDDAIVVFGTLSVILFIVFFWRMRRQNKS
jgi:hypothetical protein